MFCNGAEVRPDPVHKINSINCKCTPISLFLSFCRHVNSMADVPSSPIYKILPEDPLGIMGRQLISTASSLLSLLHRAAWCGGLQTLGTRLTVRVEVNHSLLGSMTKDFIR